MTYLLLNTINFARSGIYLSEVLCIHQQQLSLSCVWLRDCHIFICLRLVRRLQELCIVACPQQSMDCIIVGLLHDTIHRADAIIFTNLLQYLLIMQACARQFICRCRANLLPCAKTLHLGKSNFECRASDTYTCLNINTTKKRQSHQLRLK